MSSKNAKCNTPPPPHTHTQISYIDTWLGQPNCNSVVWHPPVHMKCCNRRWGSINFKILAFYCPSLLSPAFSLSLPPNYFTVFTTPITLRPGEVLFRAPHQLPPRGFVKSHIVRSTGSEGESVETSLCQVPVNIILQNCHQHPVKVSV